MSALNIPSMQGYVSTEEWQTRVDLAAAYRLTAHYGWSDLVFTHISARVPGEDGAFLINPYGLFFDEITASSLVKIDAQGTPLQETQFPVNPAGFVIHSAVHEARHDAAFVMHTHTANGVAVAAQKNGLLPISQQSIFVLASLGYHAYEGVALSDEEKPRLVADLGMNRHLMLRNHGLLTVGKSMADAFLSMYLFESACNIQIRAQAGGGMLGTDLIEINPSIIAGAMAQSQQVTKGLGGNLVWPGLLRKLDRLDASYKL
jgi:ribulose-5-phosphate 4-epimerase/fuculose-1-phosphate aldolase